MRTAVSECATFSDFTDVETDLVNEKRGNKNIFRQSRDVLLNLQCRLIHLSCKREISNGKSRKFDCLVWRCITMRMANRKRGAQETSRNTNSWRLFLFSLTRSVSTSVKSLKVAHSDTAVRIRFHNGSDVFSTPSSTPQTPSSWPPRPGLTGLGPSCVADHVVPVSVPNVFKNRGHVVAPAVAFL